MELRELFYAIASAHTMGLTTLGEAISGWDRMLIHLEYSKIPEHIAAMRAELEHLGFELPLSEEVCAQSIYDFNTKYAIGVDFAEEDRKMEEWMASFADEVAPEDFH